MNYEYAYYCKYCEYWQPCYTPETSDCRICLWRHTRLHYPSLPYEDFVVDDHYTIGFAPGTNECRLSLWRYAVLHLFSLQDEDFDIAITQLPSLSNALKTASHI